MNFSGVLSLSAAELYLSHPSDHGVHL